MLSLVLDSPVSTAPLLADGAMPGPSPPGHCAATHPPETDRHDAETPGRVDRVGEMKESESGKHRHTWGWGERSCMSPRLGRHKPWGGVPHGPHDTIPSTHSGKEGREGQVRHHPESKARNLGSR